MCCFSRPVPFVGGTRIFTRGEPSGAELLAYSMNVEVPEDLAMVLPLPVPPRPDEDAVRFIDLEGYEKFFGDLERAFPPMFAMMPAAKSRGGAPTARALAVHDVGRFEASFVPTLADFARLDERFRVPPAAWERLPKYQDYGFAVFRLRPRRRRLRLGSARQTIHPMALSFPRRDPASLFIPTVHVHDGDVHDTAGFDHQLYVQPDAVLDAILDWTASTSPLQAHVDVVRAKGLVDGTRRALATSLFGPLANEDVWLHAPAGVSVEDLSGRGECHAYQVRATHAVALPELRGETAAPPGIAAFAARGRRWRETASRRLAALCKGLREGLCELEQARRHSWALMTLSDDLPAHFINGDQLWTGDGYERSTGRSRSGGPGRVRFSPFSDGVEPQSVTLAFAQLPDQDRVTEIRGVLASLLDRSVA